jgi:hypothetical protein
MPFDNTEEEQIKDLKDLSCVWCDSYDAHSCLGERIDHITGDMTRTIKQ